MNSRFYFVSSLILLVGQSSNIFSAVASSGTCVLLRELKFLASPTIAPLLKPSPSITDTYNVLRHVTSIYNTTHKPQLHKHYNSKHAVARTHAASKKISNVLFDQQLKTMHRPCLENILRRTGLVDVRPLQAISDGEEWHAPIDTVFVAGILKGLNNNFKFFMHERYHNELSAKTIHSSLAVLTQRM